MFILHNLNLSVTNIFGATFFSHQSSLVGRILTSVVNTQIFRLSTKTFHRTEKWLTVLFTALNKFFSA